MTEAPKVAVVIPCYCVSRQIAGVLARVPARVDRIVVVDDACPERSGEAARQASGDPRLTVLRLHDNRGVGGATLAGMAYALQAGADILVKLDGDGQHDPELVNQLIAPVASGEADYTKGNRFFRLDFLKSMPTGRLIGNAGLSFLSKLSSGYWTLMDPTNGFIAVHARVLALLPPGKLQRRYLFESDLLFRLGAMRAKVMQIPMVAAYADERSGLSPRRMVLSLLRWHGAFLIKRIFYTYILRGFSLASIYLLLGCVLTVAALFAGSWYWTYYASLSANAPAGTVAFVALLAVFGPVLLISFFSHDMMSEPREPIHAFLPNPDSAAVADQVLPAHRVLDPAETPMPLEGKRVG